jgi:hypothetical protein
MNPINKIKLTYQGNPLNIFKNEIKEAWKAEKQINQQINSQLHQQINGFPQSIFSNVGQPHLEGKKLPKIKKQGNVHSYGTKPQDLVSIYGSTRPKLKHPQPQHPHQPLENSTPSSLAMLKAENLNKIPNVGIAEKMHLHSLSPQTAAQIHPCTTTTATAGPTNYYSTPVSMPQTYPHSNALSPKAQIQITNNISNINNITNHNTNHINININTSTSDSIRHNKDGRKHSQNRKQNAQTAAGGGAGFNAKISGSGSKGHHTAHAPGYSGHAGGHGGGHAGHGGYGKSGVNDGRVRPLTSGGNVGKSTPYMQSKKGSITSIGSGNHGSNASAGNGNSNLKGEGAGTGVVNRGNAVVSAMNNVNGAGNPINSATLFHNSEAKHGKESGKFFPKHKRPRSGGFVRKTNISSNPAAAYQDPFNLQKNYLSNKSSARTKQF